MGNILNNECIWIPLIIWFIVQCCKVVGDLISNKKFNLKRFVGAGGMPSSHSALVTSLATVIACKHGFESTEFALSVMFACIVMYDAAGVRRAAGKQAQVLNQIIENWGKKEMNIQEKLTELLGHTPLQVFVGALIGIVISYGLWLIW